MEYYSAIKKNEILPFPTTWMDLEGIMLSERQILYDLTYMWKIKNKQQKNHPKLKDTERRLVIAGRGHKTGEGGQKVQTSSYTLN